MKYRDCAGDVIAWMAAILPGKIKSNDAEIASQIYVTQFDSAAMLRMTSLLRSNARVAQPAARCCRAKSDVTDGLCTISIPIGSAWRFSCYQIEQVGTRRLRLILNYHVASGTKMQMVQLVVD